MFRPAVSQLFHLVALAITFAAVLTGCDKDSTTSVPPESTGTERMRAYAQRCEAGDTDSCQHVARLCADDGDAECAAMALTNACKQGSIASCETLFAVLRESAKDCATEEACIEAMGTAKKLDEFAKSPENDALHFSSLDRLCHQFKRGDACAMTAQVLQTNNQPAKEVAEHILLACQHGHQESCQTVTKVAENMCQAESPEACYVIALQASDPRKVKKLLDWSCAQGYQPACSKARELGLKGGRADRSTRPAPGRGTL